MSSSIRYPANSLPQATIELTATLVTPSLTEYKTPLSGRFFRPFGGSAGRFDDQVREADGHAAAVERLRHDTDSAAHEARAAAVRQRLAAVDRDGQPEGRAPAATAPAAD